MKFCSYILLIYLVSLSVIPCCAFDDCPDDQKITDTGDTSNDSNKKDCGACSPFFNCEKCASGSIKVEGLVLTTEEIAILSIYSEFIPSRLRAVYYEFFQPPRSRYC